MEGYFDFYQGIYRRALSLQVGGSFFLSCEEFSALIAPVADAAAESELKLLDGTLCRRNNRGRCHVLPLPSSVRIFMLDNGILSLWRDTLLLHARQTENGWSCRSVAFLPEGGAGELAGVIAAHNGEKIPLSAEEIRRFLDAYALSLRKLAVAEGDARRERFGWQDTADGYRYPTDTLSCADACAGAAMPALLCDGEALFAAAAVFSLLKPLLSGYRMQEECSFCLEVQLEKESLPRRRTLDTLLDLWCNFRDWENRESAEENGTFFRREAASFGTVAPWSHRHFPLVFTNYHRISERAQHVQRDVSFYPFKIRWDAPTPVGADKAEVKLLSECTCLPILLYLELDGISVLRRQKTERCLRVMLRNEELECLGSALAQTDSAARHAAVLRGMASLLEDINAAEESARRIAARESFRAALGALGQRMKGDEADRRHKAALLTALRFAAECSSQHREWLESVFSALLRTLGREAGLSDFAGFVRACLRPDSPYDGVLFYRDDDGIYLRYKAYWSAFADYCAGQSVELICSAGAFRRSLLHKNGYIKPQYEVNEPGKYLRYDYRKVAGDVEETVLNVSPRLLEDY